MQLGCYYFLLILLYLLLLSTIPSSHMSRSTPWRHKPTPLITQMIPIAKQLKLYLLNQIGPTSLILKDQNDNKFKVLIGDTVNCSCAVVKNDHCIHSLFVMLKKFKVSQNHPILWQASYLDSQLDGLTQHKYQQTMKSKAKINAKQFLKRKKQQKKQDQQDFPPLDQEQVCPICYQQMNGQCYSSCQTCHKCFHTKCFKVWTTHKQNSQSPVTCPMCRNKFTNPLKIIFRDLQRWQSRFSTHKGSVCKSCGQKNIKGLIYKCLICANSELCKLCYQGNQHLQHNLFCVKQLSTDKWKIAPIRVKKTKKQLFQPTQDIDSKQLPLLQSPQFILSLLPTIKQFNAKQNKQQLGIVGNFLLSKTLCTKCHTPGNQQMIRLHCSHPIHQECLLSMIQNKQYLCQADNQIICPGYWNALGVKIVKPSKKLVSDLKFTKNNQQIQLLERKNALNQTYQPFNKNSKQQRNLSLGMAIDKQTISGVNRISGIKVKQTKVVRPSSIVKKSALERKHEIQSLSIGGFGMKFTSNVVSQGVLGFGQPFDSYSHQNIRQQITSNNIIWGNNKISHRPPIPHRIQR